jgi:hypothetical protein
MTKAISQTLNMHPLHTINVPKQEIETHTDDQLLFDLDEARRNIKELGDIGMIAVKEAADLASQSQHDKLYTALSSLMKSTLETQRELLDVHRSRKELTQSGESDGDVTNNLFIGSTDELLALLEKK